MYSRTSRTQLRVVTRKEEPFVPCGRKALLFYIPYLLEWGTNVLKKGGTAGSRPLVPLQETGGLFISNNKYLGGIRMGFCWRRTASNPCVQEV